MMSEANNNGSITLILRYVMSLTLNGGFSSPMLTPMISHQSTREMLNLSWTPYSNPEKDNSLNHSCVSPSMGCLEYT